MNISEIGFLTEDLFCEHDVQKIMLTALNETTDWVVHSTYEEFSQHLQEIVEGKKINNKKPEMRSTPSMNPNAMQVRTCPIFDESIRAHPETRETVDKFVEFKFNDPTGIFNPKKPKELFKSGGPIGLLGLSMRHTHISRDLSIVHCFYGKLPITLDLYGVFSHQELGTGDPANIRRQQQMAQRFKNQQFFNWKNNF